MDLVSTTVPYPITNIDTVPVMSDHDVAMVLLDTTVKCTDKNTVLCIYIGEVTCIA